ncbi:MAG: response regulator, partial [Candidatus Thermoplasmatota archaeon]|nr:response regulator [Candidatus Thermoplasmatota archaeon]
MEALVELEKKKFDLVLADYKMPVMNGIELLALVKKNYPKTVRILITAFGDKNSAIEAINTAEVHSYLEKPWDDRELQLNVYEILARKYERDNASIKAISKVKDAFKLLKKYQKNLTPIPAKHISKQLI